MDSKIARALKGLPVHFNYELSASADDEPRGGRGERAERESRRTPRSFRQYDDWN
jgi:hypothetical protein